MWETRVYIHYFHPYLQYWLSLRGFHENRGLIYNFYEELLYLILRKTVTRFCHLSQVTDRLKNGCGLYIDVPDVFLLRKERPACEQRDRHSVHAFTSCLQTATWHWQAMSRLNIAQAHHHN